MLHDAVGQHSRGPLKKSIHTPTVISATGITPHVAKTSSEIINGENALGHTKCLFFWLHAISQDGYQQGVPDRTQQGQLSCCKRFHRNQSEVRINH
jgi:hypothetical protein